MVSLFLLTLLVLPWTGSATSYGRNALHSLSRVHNARILTPGRRVHAHTSFDLDFDLDDGRRQVKLTLEPNHDILGPGAAVNYMGADGQLLRTEVIDRLDHKVYRGTAKVQDGRGSWRKAGFARVTVTRDGADPLFEGAFSLDRDNHHIQLRSTYLRTMHAEDPLAADGAEMVVWRDSDIISSRSSIALAARDEIDRGSCSAHELAFNSRPDHPVYQSTLKTPGGDWGSMSLPSLFGKRQIDTQPSGGNSAGVDLSSTIGQSAGCPSSRKVALVGVATDCGYTAQVGADQVRSTIIGVMNSASNVWESFFNISLGLQNITISDATCPGTPHASTLWNQACSDSVDIADRLNLFSAWRGTLTDANSHWTLFTACNTSSTVGLAWLGQACKQNAITANGTDGATETVSGTNVVAVTGAEWQVVAHETGHTFGAVHDCDSTTCAQPNTVALQQCCPLSSSACDADSQYIMNPYASSNINDFSLCTVGNICSALLRNSVNGSCLVDNTGVVTATGKVCGNGIVEEGEECDCGGTAGCAGDPCCDGKTCKLTAGSVCDDANESCCQSCQFASNSTICRPSTGTCDPEENCTGSAAQCPTDQLAPDGQTCTISGADPGLTGSLACASGQCTSRNLQCQTALASYTNGANDTYACDDSTCALSCASPAFPPNTCYGLKQNMLAGTPCGAGGACNNGQCEGTSFSKEVQSWVDNNKGVVIGISVALGCLLILLIISCIAGCVRRRKRRDASQRSAAIASQAASNGPAQLPWGPPLPPPIYTSRPMAQRESWVSANQPWNGDNGVRGGESMGWMPPPQPQSYSGWRNPNEHEPFASGPPSPWDQPSFPPQTHRYA